MRDILVLKSVTNTSDGEGGYVPTIAVVKSIFAKVEPLKESRVLDANQLEYTQAYRIYIRYDAAINNTNLLNYKGKDLTIHSAIDISGLNQFIEVIAYTNE